MVIFIVEDERWALQEMSQLLREYKPQHTVYAFSNGDDALTKMRQVTPQLMITDINMPVMTGLELIEQAINIDSQIKSIILTVHDEFEYAHKGIELGVIDYLLKPVKKVKLYEVIDKVLAEIENENMEIQKSKQWSINELLFSSHQPIAVDDDGGVENQPFVVIYMLLENWQSTKDWSTVPINDETIKQYVTSQDEKIENTWVLTIDKNRKLMLIPIVDKDHTQLQSLVGSFFHFVNEHAMVHMSYAVKEKHDKLRGVFDVVHHQMDQNMIFGHASLIEPNQSQADKDLTDIWMRIRALEISIQHGDLLKIKHHVEKIINIIAYKNLTLNQLSLLLYDAYYAILYKLTKSTAIFETTDENFDLTRFDGFSQLEKWLENTMYKLVEQNVPQSITPKNLIPKLIEWAKQMYTENITFQQFADEHHVSLSYLSREFKVQLGVTFSEFLTQYRVDKAKEYFKNGLDRTSEVGQLVGYSDPKHFRTVFKKVTGLSPKEYKEIM